MVDNNSSDSTSDVARSLLRTGTDMLLREPQQGKGFAVKRGLSRLSAEIYVMTDGDMTYSASDARRLFDKILDCRADMLVGDRLAEKGYARQNSRFGHSVGNSFLTWVVSLLSGKNYNDVLSGLRIMSGPFVATLDVRSSGFQLETEINLSAAYLRADVIEEPILYGKRPAGTESKLSTYRDGFRILGFAMTNWIAFSPLQFFTFITFFSWMCAISLGYRVISGFLEYGWPYSTTAVIAAGSGIIGTLALFTGLSLRIQGRVERRRQIAEFLERKRIWNTNLDARLL